jgi:hypothetical protein
MSPDLSTDDQDGSSAIVTYMRVRAKRPDDNFYGTHVTCFKFSR